VTATCPYCQDEIEVESLWHDNDYSSVFTLTCKTCGNQVSAVVNLNPEFYLSELPPVQ
jgi:transcription elongation factor Elf1